MRRSLTVLGVLILVSFVMIGPVAAQTEDAGDGSPSRQETTRDQVLRYVDSAIQGQREAPSGDAGGGVTWVDFLRRVLTSVEGVQFDETDNGLRFTWNITDEIATILDFVTDPTLYGPVKETAGGDSDLLRALNDQVGAGDDWTVTARYIPGFVKTKKNGDLNSHGRSIAFRQLRDGLDAIENRLWPEGRPEWVDQRTTAEPAEVQRWTRNAVRAMTAVPEFEIDLFYRERGDFVGPDEYGASAQYTWARGSANSRKTWNALTSVGQRIFAGVSTTGKDEKRYRLISQEQRITAKIDYSQRKEYELSDLVPTPVYREGNRTLVGTAAWSVRFPNDNKKDPSRTPRYELQASYEDIDNDPERQSRAILRAIFTRRVRFLGDTTEITAGILWSNRPEYVSKQDSDAQLGANVALSFNFGETGGG